MIDITTTDEDATNNTTELEPIRADVGPMTPLLDAASKWASDSSLRRSTLLIPEATVVVENEDDEEVFIGTPLEPQCLWWKLKRVLLIGVVVLILLITVGVLSSIDCN